MASLCQVLLVLSIILTATSAHLAQQHPAPYHKNDLADTQYFNPFLGNYKKTCTIPGKCKVQISTKNQVCQKLRLVDIQRARKWYKLTNANSKIKFPYATQIPWLDQTIPDLTYYYGVDRFEGRYSMLLEIWLKAVNENIGPKIGAAFQSYPFVTQKEYLNLRSAWDNSVQSLKTPQYFANPTQYPDFTDHLATEEWKTDESFVQRRLAGECPFLLRKVLYKAGNGINYSELSFVINHDFFDSFKMSVSKKRKITMQKAINENRLFVLYLPDMDELKPVKDALDPLGADPNKEMRPLKTQITFFVVNDDGELAVVAIQTGPKPEDEVLTPASDAHEWQMAKSDVELTFHSFCQAKMHLGGIHWVTTVYCLTFRRHLSTKHPLYDFFKHHCEGTVPQISTTYGAIIGPKAPANLFFTIGSAGFEHLSKKSFDERNYETFTYENFIKGQGLDDKKIKYYPFRDDAKVILDEYERFANELVNQYYRGFFNKQLVKNDKELQSWVKELSAHGQGNGKMVGFPPKFTRNHQLKTFIQRFLWYNVFHSSVNYALALPTPMSPSKLYQSKDSSEPFGVYQAFSVGGGAGIASIATSRGTLGDFRANRIFDYYDQVNDPKFERIVRKYYYRLHRCVQKTLATRNAERKAKNQLGYQFIEPKWLTNSIHI